MYMKKDKVVKINIELLYKKTEITMSTYKYNHVLSSLNKVLTIAYIVLGCVVVACYRLLYQV